jgi:hypothetical protein
VHYCQRVDRRESFLLKLDSAFCAGMVQRGAKQNLRQETYGQPP